MIHSFLFSTVAPFNSHGKDTLKKGYCEWLLEHVLSILPLSRKVIHRVFTGALPGYSVVLPLFFSSHTSPALAEWILACENPAAVKPHLGKAR